MKVVQVVPLYFKSNATAFAYFRDHLDDISAITGKRVIVQVPGTVLSGDAKDLGQLPELARYKGKLQLSDAPCLLLEYGREFAVLPIPPEVDEITRTFAAMRQELAAAASPDDLAQRVRQTMNQRRNNENPEIAATSGFFRFLVQALSVGRKKVTQREYPTYVGYLVYAGVVVTLVTSVVFAGTAQAIIAATIPLALLAVLVVLTLLWKVLHPFVLNLLAIATVGALLFFVVRAGNIVVDAFANSTTANAAGNTKSPTVTDADVSGNVYDADGSPIADSALVSVPGIAGTHRTGVTGEFTFTVSRTRVLKGDSIALAYLAFGVFDTATVALGPKAIRLQFKKLARPLRAPANAPRGTLTARDISVNGLDYAPALSHNVAAGRADECNLAVTTSSSGESDAVYEVRSDVRGPFRLLVTYNLRHDRSAHGLGIAVNDQHVDAATLDTTKSWTCADARETRVGGIVTLVAGLNRVRLFKPSDATLITPVLSLRLKPVAR